MPLKWCGPFERTSCHTESFLPADSTCWTGERHRVPRGWCHIKGGCHGHWAYHCGHAVGVGCDRAVGWRRVLATGCAHHGRCSGTSVFENRYTEHIFWIAHLAHCVVVCVGGVSRNRRCGRLPSKSWRPLTSVLQRGLYIEVRHWRPARSDDKCLIHIYASRCALQRTHISQRWS